MPDSAPDSLRRVDAVANRFVEEYAALDSLAATYLGISGYDDKVNDLSPDGYQARESLTRQSLREVEGTEPVDERETAAKESLVERMTVTLAQYDARTPQPQVSVIFSELHARHARRPGNAGHPRHDRHRHASGAGDPAEQPGRLPPGPDVDACARAGLPAPALPIGRRHHQVRAQPLPRVPGQAPSYKVGERIWLQARDDVRRRQGVAFDLKGFHRSALDLGSLGLDPLRAALSRL